MGVGEETSKRASGLLCRGFLYRHLRRVENGPYEGGSKTPFWEGCHSRGFPTPSFFHPPIMGPMASSENRSGWGVDLGI